jgi:hypothetical protein
MNTAGTQVAIDANTPILAARCCGVRWYAAYTSVNHAGVREVEHFLPALWELTEMEGQASEAGAAARAIFR